MRLPLLATALAITSLACVGAVSAQVAGGQSATAEVKAGDGKALGTATLTEAPHGVLLRLELKGLTPGWHGLHFHEKGDCGTPDFKSAGAHVHTTANVVHGLLNPDANDNGDLPNLFAGADGSATAEVFSPQVLAADAPCGRTDHSIAGKGLIVHRDPDDYKTQPTGNAGATPGLRQWSSRLLSL